MLVWAGLVAVLAAADPPGLAPVRTLDVVWSGERLYACGSDGLRVLDAGEPGAARVLGRLALDGVARCAVSADRAWIAAGSRGLVLADVADPAAPRLLARQDLPAEAFDVLLGEHPYLYTATGREGLAVFDRRDPLRPLRVAAVGTAGIVRSLALGQRLLAAAEGSAGLQLLDVTHPDTPRMLAPPDEAQGAIDVALTENRLLVAAGRRGLLIYPRDGNKVGRTPRVVPLDGSAVGVAEFAGRAVVALGDHGLAVVDPGSGHVVHVRIPGSPPVLRVAVTPAGRAFLALDHYGIGEVDLEAADGPLVLAPRPRRFTVRSP